MAGFENIAPITASINASAAVSGIGSNDDEVTWQPSAREAFHSNSLLCNFITRQVQSKVELTIRSSKLCSGSGLFIEESLPEGREIYRSKPLFVCVEGDMDSICHYCLKDAKAEIHSTGRIREPGEEAQAKLCMNCKVARFCSKACQKAAWAKFHKHECGILKANGIIRARTLAVYRLLFWQRRNLITFTQGEAIEFMENHFNDYSQSDGRSGEIQSLAMVIRKAVGGANGTPSLALVWRLVPAMATNCIRVRLAHRKESIGAALDLLTASINHSCDPNAFVFWEEGQLRVRSLKSLTVGEELTICYVDPTSDLVMRRSLLERHHFFYCRCTRCSSESRERWAMCGSVPTVKAAFHKAQEDVLALIASVCKAAKYPGLRPYFEDLPKVEAHMLNIIKSPFTDTSKATWLEHVEPLPSARMALATFNLKQEKLVPALRLAMQGLLMNCSRSGAQRVNDMYDMLHVLLVVGDAPNVLDEEEMRLRMGGVQVSKSQGQGGMQARSLALSVRQVVFGYMREMCELAALAYGNDSKYTMAICDMYAGIVRMVDPKPGQKDFNNKFTAAQAVLMEWAGVPKKHRIMLRSCE